MEFVQGGEFFVYLRTVGKVKPLDAAYIKFFQDIRYLLKKFSLFNVYLNNFKKNI